MSQSSDPSKDGTDSAVGGSCLSASLLAQQIPPLPTYSGNDPDDESFQDWLLQFEMIADLYKWSTPAKLVHLTTWLRGQVFQFYKSCAPKQKVQWTMTLLTELKKRFTPVRIQAVQTSNFHERRQRSGESVDGFAQDLQHLYHKAYPATSCGSKETEEMGQTVLANQFAAGLLPELKAKVAGSEGDLDKLLTKTRFEEAKLHDLPPQSHQKKPARPLQRM